MEKIYKFKKMLPSDNLKLILNSENVSDLITELDFEIDFTNLDQHIQNILEGGNLEELTSNKAAKWDAQMSTVVHETFKSLPRNLLLDMSFWQWLSINRYKKFSYLRWWASKNKNNLNNFLTDYENVSKQDSYLINSETGKYDNFINRLLGGKSIKALNTLNCFSRLFWVSEHLYDEAKKYEISSIAFEKQDIIVSLFERLYSLNNKIAKSFVISIVKKHPNLEKKTIQLEAKKLNQYFSTINADYLDEDDLVKLI